MEIFQKYKKIFIVLGIVIALFLIYKVFFSGIKSTDVSVGSLDVGSGLVSEISVSPADAIVGRELLSMLSRLKSITIDSSIFDDEVFNDLDDLSKPIADQPFGKNLGRRNPFLDFGVVSGTSTASKPVGGATGSGVLNR